jgi:TonB family protein
MSLHPAAVEVFCAREIAQAAGVPLAVIQRAIRAEALDVHAAGYLAGDDAVALVRRFAAGSPFQPHALFEEPQSAKPRHAPALAASGAIHAAILVILIVITGLGLSSATPQPETRELSRLVFIVSPGPGGGGGGGGLRMQAPPARAELKSAAKIKSPVPPPRIPERKQEPRAEPVPPPAPRPEPTPVEPRPVPPPAPVTPQVVAPVVTASSDTRDRAGLPVENPTTTESQGSGSGGGAGTGDGTGLGSGSGAGIGPGSGGGTGGGPYRPGSGVTAPQLLHEVRPEYTEDARRRGITGDVVLEIVVRSNGTVGEIRVMQGLGAGLDARAVEAVRQWRFAPARRAGTPVDVAVEVAVEFKLR